MSKIEINTIIPHSKKSDFIRPHIHPDSCQNKAALILSAMLASEEYPTVSENDFQTPRIKPYSGYDPTQKNL